MSFPHSDVEYIKIGVRVVKRFAEQATRAIKFMRSRVGSVLMLTLVCFICAISFSSYMSPESSGEENINIFTNDTESREIVVQSGVALAGSEEIVVRLSDSDAAKSNSTGITYDVTLYDAGIASQYFTDAVTVEQFLDENAVILGKNDVVTPALSDSIYNYMSISIDRVEFEDIATNEIVPCKTVKVETNELRAGETKIVTAGSDGIKTVITRKIYVNGEFSRSEVISEEITTASINRVVQVGTRKDPEIKTEADNVKTFLDSAGRKVAYSKLIKGKGSAYTEAPGTTGTTGRPLSVGIVAVDPDVIPYGTRLYITSSDGRYVYGYALAADTNSVVESGAAVVSLYYDSDSQCKAFGSRDVNVYILEN